MSTLSTQNIYLTNKLVNDLRNFNEDRISFIEDYVGKVLHSGIVKALIETHKVLMDKPNGPLFKDYTAVKSDLIDYLLNTQLRAEDPWREHVREVLFETQAILAHPRLTQGIEILKEDIQSLKQNLDEYMTLLPSQNEEILKFKRHLTKLENNLNTEEYTEALRLSHRLTGQLKKITEAYENSLSSLVQNIENKPHKRTKNKHSFIHAFLKKTKKL